MREDGSAPVNHQGNIPGDPNTHSHDPIRAGPLPSSAR
jgi:hypothetical protein